MWASMATNPLALPTVTTQGSEFLPAAQIRLETLQSENRLRDEQQRSSRRIGKRMGGLELGLKEVNNKLDNHILASNKRADATDDLVKRAIGGNDEILRRMEAMTLEAKHIETETADGVKVVKTVTRWKQTAADFEPVLKWVKRGVYVLVSLVGGRLIGWIFGTEIRDKIAHFLGLQ